MNVGFNMPKILIVEDDIVFATALTRILARFGYQCFSAKNGSEGIAMVELDSPDVVLTDIVMPEKEGIEFIIEMREKFPCIPLIAMSGGGTRGEMTYLKIARSLGAVSTLEKPFPIEQVVTEIERVLGTKRPKTRTQ